MAGHRGGMGRGQRDGDHRVGPQPGTIRCAVKLAQPQIDHRLIVRIQTEEGRGNDGVDSFNRAQNSRPAQPRRVTIAKLQCFEVPLARAAGSHGAAGSSAVTGDLDLDRGPAAAVEDFPREDSVDAGRVIGIGHTQPYLTFQFVRIKNLGQPVVAGRSGPWGQYNRRSMNSTKSVDRPRRVYPGGAMILHYKTADNVVPAPAGLAPVER